jgi:hypothetical protein
MGSKMIQNNKLQAGYISYAGKIFNQVECDSYNRHVEDIAVMLRFQAVEDDSLSGRALTAALQRRAKCFVSIATKYTGLPK